MSAMRPRDSASNSDIGLAPRIGVSLAAHSSRICALRHTTLSPFASTKSVKCDVLANAGAVALTLSYPLIAESRLIYPSHRCRSEHRVSRDRQAELGAAEHRQRPFRIVNRVHPARMRVPPEPLDRRARL